MKTLNRWKTVFIVASTAFLIVCSLNWLLDRSLSLEAISRRPFYLVLSVIFYVAGIVLGIVKGVVEEETA